MRGEHVGNAHGWVKVMVAHYDGVMFAGAVMLLVARAAGAITSYTHARADLVVLRRTVLSSLGRGSGFMCPFTNWLSIIEESGARGYSRRVSLTEWRRSFRTSSARIMQKVMCRDMAGE